MTKITNNSDSSNYLKQLKVINYHKDSVKSFLPFLKQFSFLDANYAINDLLENYMYEKGNSEEKRDLYYYITQISEYIFNIHALLNGWEVRTFQSLEKIFDNLVCELNFNPLETCHKLDFLLDYMAKDDNYEMGKIVRVTLELRKAFLRSHCLQKKIKMSAYLGE